MMRHTRSDEARETGHARCYVGGCGASIECTGTEIAEACFAMGVTQGNGTAAAVARLRQIYPNYALSAVSAELGHHANRTFVGRIPGWPVARDSRPDD